jgi:NAD(P)-dependent dehydrogenase (short-subunit alcohol dehydrogenase family)
VVIDVGTTAAEVTRNLPTNWTGPVVANSLLVAAELADHDGIEPTVLGGRIRSGDLAASGPQIPAVLAELYADSAFLGSGGLDARADLTDYHSDEVQVRRLMGDHAARNYVLADVTMFDVVAARVVCPLRDLDAMITDRALKAPRRSARRLRRPGAASACPERRVPILTTAWRTSNSPSTTIHVGRPSMHKYADYEAPSVLGHDPTRLGVADMPSALLEDVIAGMRGRGWGRVTTSTSSGVIEPVANLGLSNTLRAGLAGWSKTLARGIAADGVIVDIVIPGRIRFLDQAKAARVRQPVDQFVAASTQSIPIGRYEYPAEYAEVIAFLASERASYLTGTIVRVDRGPYRKPLTQ